MGKKNIKENGFKNFFIKITFYAITLIVGYIISDISAPLRENLNKGYVVIENMDIDQQIDARFTLNKNEEVRLYNIKNDKKYYFNKGEYKYVLYIGQYIIDENVITIKIREKTIIKIPKLPKRIFNFNINIDKEVYGPGNTILTTIFSTYDAWVYFYHNDGKSFEELNKNGIFINAFNPIMIDNITARKSIGNDNIIAIALIKNDKEMLKNILDLLRN